MDTDQEVKGITGAAGSLGFGVPPDTSETEPERNKAIVPPYAKGDAVLWVSKNMKARVRGVRTTSTGHVVYTIKVYDSEGADGGLAVCTADDLARLNVKAVKRSTKTLAGAAVWIRSLAALLRIDHQVNAAEVYKAMALLRDASRNKEVTVIRQPFVSQAMRNLQAAFNKLKRDPKTDVRQQIASAMVAMEMVKPALAGNTRSLTRQYKSWKMIALSDFLNDVQELEDPDWPALLQVVKADVVSIFGEADATKSLDEASSIREFLSQADSDDASEAFEAIRAELSSLLDVGGVEYADGDE